jgi:MEDS: MEthanogen/methylotroph, DcmR Sensory domain
MDSRPRHQCLIYDGAPSRQLPALAAIARDRLQTSYRVLYLNSVPMVAGMRSYLAAAGVDVAAEVERGSLVLSSEQAHLVDGHFSVERMLQTLEETLAKALRDGYVGLWATGDMTWEMGPDRDFGKLLEYERRLEEFFAEHAQLNGVCQYHVETMPREALRHGLLAHPTLFVNETLSRLNPVYAPPAAFARVSQQAALDALIDQLCQAENVG